MSNSKRSKSKNKKLMLSSNNMRPPKVVEWVSYDEAVKRLKAKRA